MTTTPHALGHAERAPPVAELATGEHGNSGRSTAPPSSAPHEICCVALGADLESDGLRETPRRMADTYIELLTPRPFAATTFDNDEGYDQLIIVRDIPFQSLCMHHVLPFHGVAHIAYLPSERILGLSKLARVVDLFARDLQLQERLTTQIANWLEEELQPMGVGSCWRPSTSA